MRSLVSLSLALGLVVGLAACDAVSPEAAVSDAKPADAQAGPWTHNVTGGGADFYPDEDDDITFNITFNARANGDGDVVGRVDLRFPDGRPASYGDVYCLEVRGNQAHIGYRVVGGEYGGYGTPGNTVALSFEDNGEGQGAIDRQSFIYLSDGEISCVGHADFIESSFGFPVEWVRGNVQVR